MESRKVLSAHAVGRIAAMARSIAGLPTLELLVV